MTQTSRTLLAVIVILAARSGDSLAGQPPTAVRSFLESSCLDCHDGADAEAGFDLASLLEQPDRPAELSDWVRIHDRVRDGEMPPADYENIPPGLKRQFLEATGSWLSNEQRLEHRELGRVRGRRLTNLQLERSLHDLLGIDIPLANRMPDEPRSAGFTTVADGQTMSHFHLEEHVSVVDVALEEAFRRALEPADEWERNLSAEQIVRRRRRKRTREPELIDGLAVTWASRLIFYGRLPATTARESGWYRFTIRAKALKPPEEGGVWCTVRTGLCKASAPLLGWVGAFEATPDLAESTFEAWLPKGHMLEVRPGDATLKMARFRGGQVGAGEGDPQNVSGVAIESIKMERIHRGPDDASIRRLLLGTIDAAGTDLVSSAEPRVDVPQLIRTFARRAFRRPVSDEDLRPYLALVYETLDAGDSFETAIHAGYRALLCSPRFLYFYEQPGKLDDHAIASRLSYLLWNRMPDEELFRLADASELRNAEVIGGQIERMLEHPFGKHFVEDFAAQWLDLSLIDFTEPDRKLYPGFDVIVQNAMLAETRTYLQTMLDEDLGVEYLIDSDFTFLNGRLARYYGIEGVDGDDLRRTRLDPRDHRGGLLTQGAILKVTANGTTTSPVIRGVWISERLLGEFVPPPPDSVPAIEPDIRGATTIRELLAKHKADQSCASCHTKVDPPGFALENYDPSGRWREKYLRRGKRRREGLPVEAGYQMADGESFSNIEEFRELVLRDREKLGRSLAEKLLVYGTGAPIRFADREAVETIVAASAGSLGLRSILRAVATSTVFLSK